MTTSYTIGSWLAYLGVLMVIFAFGAEWYTTTPLVNQTYAVIFFAILILVLLVFLVALALNKSISGWTDFILLVVWAGLVGELTWHFYTDPITIGLHSPYLFQQADIISGVGLLLVFVGLYLLSLRKRSRRKVHVTYG